MALLLPTVMAGVVGYAGVEGGASFLAGGSGRRRVSTMYEEIGIRDISARSLSGSGHGSAGAAEGLLSVSSSGSVSGGGLSFWD